MYKIVLAFMICAISCATVQAQPVGLDFYDNLAALPFIYDNVQSYYISSYDRTGGNDDGFRGTYSQLYVQDNGEHVIFDEDGPGCIYNFWFTGDDQRLHWGKIRIYVDGQEMSTFESPDEKLFLGESAPFVEPLVNDSFVSSGGFSCSAPIPFRKHLKITTEKTVGFYNIYYQLYKDVDVKSWTPHQDYSSLIRLFERCGSDPKQVSEPLNIQRQLVSLDKAAGSDSPEVQLVALDHPGTIQFIKINPLFRPDLYSLNHTYLRIFYDGAETAAADVPLGPFFGSGLGEADVRSLFVGMSSSGTYYSFLPMPFRKGIRITLQNQSHEAGGEFSCQVGYTRQLPPGNSGTLGYFGAEYRRAWPITATKDYVLFDYQGRGAVVGQVMTVEPVAADVKRWWEGDMRITIDGEEKPRFHGTGHEDEYQGGWSTFWLTNPYSLPLFGEPKTENLVNVFGQVNGSTSAYRFWPGKIHFAKSITISTEHGNQNDTPANYSSLVYYYYVAPGSM
ncbi:MAG: glycoside hydrolase family 172 protein [Pirellulaceae bacterium]